MPLVVRVGATHKLKPSPTRYLSAYSVNSTPTLLQTSDSGLPSDSTPNTTILFSLYVFMSVFEPTSVVPFPSAILSQQNQVQLWGAWQHDLIEVLRGDHGQFSKQLRPVLQNVIVLGLNPWGQGQKSELGSGVEVGVEVGGQGWGQSKGSNWYR